ncbi:YIP1 family protein [uncultured Abyssibacter sp.]|uniref:YIP1 family protein n=1 Tax=uncultured Abyssibacter sp. TaxID=2320202 RepID=UPI0032B2D401
MARGFVQRIVGAARLDIPTFEEVEHDRSATIQAGGVVVLVAIASGLGLLKAGGLATLLIAMLSAVLGWIVWAAVIYVVGAKLLPESGTRANVGQLLRTLGFAQSPGLLRVFGFLPMVGGLVYLLATLWTIACTVIAVRQALDYRSTGRAIGVTLLGFVTNALVWWLLKGLTGT